MKILKILSVFGLIAISVLIVAMAKEVRSSLNVPAHARTLIGNGSQGNGFYGCKSLSASRNCDEENEPFFFYTENIDDKDAYLFHQVNLLSGETTVKPVSFSEYYSQIEEIYLKSSKRPWAWEKRSSFHKNGVSFLLVRSEYVSVVSQNDARISWIRRNGKDLQTVYGSNPLLTPNGSVLLTIRMHGKKFVRLLTPEGDQRDFIGTQIEPSPFGDELRYVDQGGKFRQIKLG